MIIYFAGDLKKNRETMFKSLIIHRLLSYDYSKKDGVSHEEFLIRIKRKES